jgi:RNA polymerase sigma factor (sigma-70 family)
MAASHSVPILDHVRRLVEKGSSSPSDADLLERYRARRDERAFALLVERHGSMVLNVCWSVLRHRHDAEDAVQATFLVLARNARSIRRPESLAGWLHGVAHRLALKARADSLRRQRREATATTRPVDAGPSNDPAWTEVCAILHEALSALPDRLRAPLVLAYLEGLTQNEVAWRLGLPAATVKGRIHRGRERLRFLLDRRGLTLAAGLAALLTGQAVASPLRARLVEMTVQVVRGLLAETAAATPVASLAGETTWRLGAIKLGLLSGLLGIAGLAIVGMRLLPHASAKPAMALQGAERPSQTRVDANGDLLPDGAVARIGTVRFNHGDGLNNMLFTPDGKTILSTGGGWLRIWDAGNGREIAHLPKPNPSWDDEVVLSADGKTLISLGQESRADTLRFWDVGAHKEIRTIELPGQRRLWSVDIRNALSPDGRLALVNRTKDVRVFDVQTGKQLWQAPRSEANEQAAVFAGNDRVATVNGKHSIEVRKARTGELLRTFQQASAADFLAASADGRWLATLEHHVHAIDKLLDRDVVHLWDLSTGTEKHLLVARPARWYMNLQFTADGRSLLTWASGTNGQELTVWDTRSGESLGELSGAVGQHLAVSPDGTRLAAGSNWGKFALFDMKTRQCLSAEVSTDLHTAAISLSPDGDRVLTTGYGSIAMYEIATGKRLQCVELPANFSTDPYRVHSPDLRYALSVTRELVTKETVLHVWDIATGKALYKLPFPGEWIQLATAFSPDSAVLAVWQPGTEAVVRLWDVRTGRETASFKEPKAGWPGHLFFTPDGKSLIVAGKQTVAYEVPGGKELFSWRMPPLEDKSGMGFAVVGGAPANPRDRNAWRRLVVSPEGNLAAGILDGGFGRTRLTDRIALCDAVTGQLIRRWSDSGELANGYEEVAFSADGRLLATSDRQAIHLWEVATGQELQTFQGHRGEIRSLAFSANGLRFASASNDSTVLIWDLRMRPSATNATIAGCWEDLKGDDARRAYAAVWRLVDFGQPAVAFLSEHLQPIPATDPARIGRYVEDLDDASFTAREKAFKELAKLGDEAVPALRKALTSGPSLEAKRRVDQLLERSPNVPVPPERLRCLRALHALEQIRSNEARDVLTTMASGADYARDTTGARAALRRLAIGAARQAP